MPEPPDAPDAPGPPEEPSRGRLSRRNRERGVRPRPSRWTAGDASWPGEEPRVAWHRLDGYGPADVRAWSVLLDAGERAESEALPDALERARYAAYRAGLRHFLAEPPGPEPYADPGADPGAPGSTSGGAPCARCGHRHGLTAGPRFFSAARAGGLALYASARAPVGAALADLGDADPDAAHPSALARIHSRLRRQAYDRAVPRGRCAEPSAAVPHRTLLHPDLPAGYAGAVVWSGAAHT